MSECKARDDGFGHIMAGRGMGIGQDHGLEICRCQSPLTAAKAGGMRRGGHRRFQRLRLTPAAAFCVLGVQTVDHYCSNTELLHI